MSLTKVTYSMVSGAPFNPIDYGADPTGAADSTAAFTAMFAALTDGSECYIQGEYLITSALTISANNVTLSGAGGYSKSMIVCETASVQMLTVTGYGFKTKNIALRGDGGANGVGATVNGIKFLRADGSSDVDATLQDTTIEGMAQSVDMNGKNLSILGGLIASGLGGVLFTRVGTDESRGLMIKGVRFHSMGTIGLVAMCVELNAYATNCDISNNFGDSIYSFYEGPINGTTLDNNLLYRVSGPGITVVAATNTTQQRCGSVNGNTLFCYSPSYVGNGITLTMQNGQAIGNKVIGPRAHGIELISTTGSLISQNTIVAPNFVAADGAIYDGIKADSGSNTNLIADNHIRGAGTAARSAMNITSTNNVVMDNWVDPAYTTPYYAEIPLTVPDTAAGYFGIKKVPAQALDILGFSMGLQQPDAVSGTPVEYKASFTNGSAAEIQGSSLKTVVRSSIAASEKAEVEVWTMRTGAMTKHSTFGWQGDLAMVPLAADPTTPATGTLALSDGTAGTLSWGASGAGLYRYSGAAWVFVG